MESNDVQWGKRRVSVRVVLDTLTPVDNVCCLLRLRCAFRVSFIAGKEELLSPLRSTFLLPAVGVLWTLPKVTTELTRAPHAGDCNTWIAILLYPSQSILRRNRRSDDQHPGATKKGRRGTEDVRDQPMGKGLVGSCWLRLHFYELGV